ncbi:fatty acyl-CoA reductase 1-like [Limulus polyphemus]|uniref:Fatty acyl-CoA reductase n=1 Tax=Limulus polyphemus TaxID=6850 RepID=A0ABM1SB58_LIMPO|nr:fatty acyl-CoA reductase 1-like [Limulus polyphemus]
MSSSDWLPGDSATDETSGDFENELSSTILSNDNFENELPDTILSSGNFEIDLPSTILSSGNFEIDLPSTILSSGNFENELPNTILSSGDFENELSSTILSSGNFENELPSTILSNGNFENELPDTILSSGNFENVLPSTILSSGNFEIELPSTILGNGNFEIDLPSTILSNGNFENELSSNILSNSNFEIELPSTILRVQNSSEHLENMVREKQKDESTDPNIPPPGGGKCNSQVREFYRDRAVLVTGATGFVGKVLVEKLLRSCSRLKTIYLLLRSKDDKNVRQRLDELLLSKAFDRISSESQSVMTKIVPIAGDVTEDGLGISSSDEEVLVNNVSVVFHCAATVKFDEPFKQSVDINVVGTRRILQLCHKIKHLVALIHVSTAYSNCNRQEIDETVYIEHVSPASVIEATQWMSDSLLDTITPHLLNGRPCSYHYTKALAENLLVEEGLGLPIAIVRPSIITASWKDPIPGWVDNLNGTSGFIVATGKGILRTMMVQRSIGADVIPVDTVVNMMICVAWQMKIERPENVMVYNCTSGPINRVTWGEIERLAYPFILTHPSMEVLRYPGGSFKTNRLLNRICEVLEHEIPARIIDFLAKVLGYKPGLVQVYNRLHRAVHILEYFTTHEWTFHADNVLMLMNKLEGKDKEIFDLDIRKIDMHEYMENYVLGVRRYVLKEDDSTLPAARKKLRRVYYLGFLFRLLILCGFLRVLFKWSRLARKLWWSLASYVFQLRQVILSAASST